jgi:hypothetical protein
VGKSGQAFQWDLGGSGYNATYVIADLGNGVYKVYRWHFVQITPQRAAQLSAAVASALSSGSSGSAAQLLFGTNGNGQGQGGAQVQLPPAPSQSSGKGTQPNQQPNGPIGNPSPNGPNSLYADLNSNGGGINSIGNGGNNPNGNGGGTKTPSGTGNANGKSSSIVSNSTKQTTSTTTYGSVNAQNVQNSSIQGLGSYGYTPRYTGMRIYSDAYYGSLGGGTSTIIYTNQYPQLSLNTTNPVTTGGGGGGGQLNNNGQSTPRQPPDYQLSNGGSPTQSPQINPSGNPYNVYTASGQAIRGSGYGPGASATAYNIQATSTNNLASQATVAQTAYAIASGYGGAGTYGYLYLNSYQAQYALANPGAGTLSYVAGLGGMIFYNQFNPTVVTVTVSPTSTVNTNSLVAGNVYGTKSGNTYYNPNAISVQPTGSSSGGSSSQPSQSTSTSKSGSGGGSSSSSSAQYTPALPPDYQLSQGSGNNPSSSSGGSSPNSSNSSNGSGGSPSVDTSESTGQVNTRASGGYNTRMHMM